MLQLAGKIVDPTSARLVYLWTPSYDNHAFQEAEVGAFEAQVGAFERRGVEVTEIEVRHATPTVGLHSN